jgi:hypothetical protein
MARALSPDSVLRVREGVMACPFGDGLALLDRASGTFFILDDVGTCIWNRLSSPASVSELSRMVESEFDAPLGVVIGDVRDFVGNLVDAELVAFEQR